jgi:hypothetical protein
MGSTLQAFEHFIQYEPDADELLYEMIKGRNRHYGPLECENVHSNHDEGLEYAAKKRKFKDGYRPQHKSSGWGGKAR